AARTLHRAALGDDDVTAITTRTPATSVAFSPRLRSALRAAATLVVAALVYEAVARTGYFPPVMMPPLSKIGTTLLTNLLDGSLIAHAASTLYRVLIGMAFAVVVALPLGILMGRFKPVE